MQKGCPKCGRMIESNQKKCPYCNYDFKEIEGFFKRISDEKFVQTQKYAGLFKRIVAGLFDILTSLIFTYFILIIINNYIKITAQNISVAIPIFTVIYILYNSVLERTSWKGSLGKYILNIEVLDEYENPITFPKALLRNITKIFNVLTLGIGILMSAFPPQKQALNDKISKTLVLSKISMKENKKEFYANPLKRLAAFILDVLLIIAFCYGLLWLVNHIDKSNLSSQTKEMIETAKYIICIVFAIFYLPFTESQNGSSFGKKIMKIKVITQKDTPPNIIMALARELLLIIDILTLSFLITFISPTKQTIKDILTRTFVVDK